MLDTLIDGADRILFECLSLRRSEQILVVSDPQCIDIGTAFWQAGKARCKEAVLVQIATRKQQHSEPPCQISSIMGSFDVAILATSFSLSKTVARCKASEQGARIASLSGISTDDFAGIIQTDWRKLGSRTRRVAAQLSSAQGIKITTEKGTDLSFMTGGHSAFADDGRLTSRGAFGDFPAGKAYLSPLEGSANGVLVIDGSVSFFDGVLSEPLVVHIKDGKVVKVEDHPYAHEFERYIARHKQAAGPIVKFGVGTVDTLRVSGNALLDENAMGTVHIVLGATSSSEITKEPIQIDGVITAPDVYLDSRHWISNGCFLK